MNNNEISSDQHEEFRRRKRRRWRPHRGPSKQRSKIGNRIPSLSSSPSLMFLWMIQISTILLFLMVISCDASSLTNLNSRASLVHLDNHHRIQVILNHRIRRLLSRHKRDEEPSPIFGKGIAFWLGEPCETTCNRILFHVWCNNSTHRCECLPEYPVNVDNKFCLKALELNDRCEYSESCQYLNPNSECEPEEGVCKCAPGYYIKYDDGGAKSCVAYDSPFFIRIGSTTFDFINKIEFITLFSLIISFILILILSLMVIKLMHKNKKLAKNDPTSSTSFCDMIPPPPPIILNAQANTEHSSSSYLPQPIPTQSRQTPQPALQPPPPPPPPPPLAPQQSSLASTPSRMSPYHQDYSLQEKPPPLLSTNLNDFRRQSLSSLRSQSSTKSLSSFRSQHSYRVQLPSSTNIIHPSSSYRTLHREQQPPHCRPMSNKIIANIPPSRSSNVPHQTSAFRFHQPPPPPTTAISQSGYLLPNHLPANIPVGGQQHTQLQSHHSNSRIKCANHRCGTGSKVRSEVCLVHNMPEMLQDEIFVPTDLKPS